MLEHQLTETIAANRKYPYTLTVRMRRSIQIILPHVQSYHDNTVHQSAAMISSKSLIDYDAIKYQVSYDPCAHLNKPNQKTKPVPSGWLPATVVVWLIKKLQ